MDYEEFDRKVKRLGPSDTCVREVDGKPETMLSMRGLVLMAYQVYVEDDNPKGRDLLYEYIRYICKRGYAVKAAKALHNLKKMSAAQGKQWIRRTFDQYVTDETALLKALGFRPVR